MFETLGYIAGKAYSLSVLEPTFNQKSQITNLNPLHEWRQRLRSVLEGDSNQNRTKLHQDLQDLLGLGQDLVAPTALPRATKLTAFEQRKFEEPNSNPMLIDVGGDPDGKRLRRNGWVCLEAGKVARRLTVMN